MEPEQKSNGALVGLIIIIVILVLGGIYLWKTSDKEGAPANTETEPASSEENTTSGANVNETSSLEGDVDSMDLESLDSEI